MRPTPQIVHELDLRHWLKPDPTRTPLEARYGYILHRPTRLMGFFPLVVDTDEEGNKRDIILCLTKRELGIAYAAARREHAEIMTLPILHDSTRKIAWDISNLRERINLAEIETRPGEYPILPMNVYDEARINAVIAAAEARQLDEMDKSLAPKGIHFAYGLLGGPNQFKDPDFSD